MSMSVVSLREAFRFATSPEGCAGTTHADDVGRGVWTPVHRAGEDL